LEQWLAFAKRTCKLSGQGRIVFDYDLKIAEPMKMDIAPVDLWPVYRALGDVPVTILRGALSDVLTEVIARRMVRELPQARLVSVKNVGHAPGLDEPEAVRAITALLSAVGA
jgi:pimeloyl-ACP methyl ester carboxylesterase